MSILHAVLQMLPNKDVEQVTQKVMELLKNHSASIPKSQSGVVFVVNKHEFKMREYMENGKSSKIKLTINGTNHRCGANENSITDLLTKYLETDKDILGDDGIVDTPGGSKRKRSGKDSEDVNDQEIIPASGITEITTLTTGGSLSAPEPPQSASPERISFEHMLECLDNKIRKIHDKVVDIEHASVYKEMELSNQGATHERISLLVSKHMALNLPLVSGAHSGMNALRVARDQLLTAWDTAASLLVEPSLIVEASK